MEKIKIIILGVLFMGTLSSCSLSASDVKGAILPHHLFVELAMDEFYEEIAQNSDVDRIILISPNHFNIGFNYLQTADSINAKNVPDLDEDFIQTLVEKKSIFIEPKYFENEHGIVNHFEFFDNHFPNAKVVPVIIKKGAPQEKLDLLVESIFEQDLESTLVIASIDFTHMTYEEIAFKDDQRTINWLKQWGENKGVSDAFNEIHELSVSSDIETEEAIAMDSPETLHVLVKLMEKQNAHDFSFWKRTSTASLTGVEDPLQNTSHIFGSFR